MARNTGRKLSSVTCDCEDAHVPLPCECASGPFGRFLRLADPSFVHVCQTEGSLRQAQPSCGDMIVCFMFCPSRARAGARQHFCTSDSRYHLGVGARGIKQPVWMNLELPSSSPPLFLLLSAPLPHSWMPEAHSVRNDCNPLQTISISSSPLQTISRVEISWPQCHKVHTRNR